MSDSRGLFIVAVRPVHVCSCGDSHVDYRDSHVIETLTADDYDDLQAGERFYLERTYHTGPKWHEIVFSPMNWVPA